MSLEISVGQCSDKGAKAFNQDFHGLMRPTLRLSNSKGTVIALADGISSSAVSHVASETAVTSMLEDYFCTSESWTVKSSVHN